MRASGRYAGTRVRDRTADRRGQLEWLEANLPEDMCVIGMEDLLDDVRIDGLHSFEDTIKTVERTKEQFGDRIAVLGGIDVDFLCRSDQQAVRRRTRETLERCHAGGGYCLGTGNSVANYVPLDNYFAMLDEGRRFGS